MGLFTRQAHTCCLHGLHLLTFSMHILPYTCSCCGALGEGWLHRDRLSNFGKRFLAVVLQACHPVWFKTGAGARGPDRAVCWLRSSSSGSSPLSLCMTLWLPGASAFASTFASTE